jgi:DNA primase
MSSTTTWVDFRELRTKLRFADVLKHYGVELRVRGERATGFCPLPCHPTHEGKRRSPTFSAHLGKGLFNCFGCGAKGNALDFAAYMTGVDPNDPTALRKVAVDLQDRFVASPSRGDERPFTPARRAKATAAPAKEFAARGDAHEIPDEGSARPVLNAPLDFSLKTLDRAHPYLAERGFIQETVSYFGLGYCSRGLLQQRIAIPIHDARGQLVGYAGRLVDDAAVDDEHPKYRFPSARERDGVRYEFRKSLLLYHLFAQPEHLADLIVVEGFASVWWLWQCGFANTVALMGSSCSPEQAALIIGRVVPSGRVWVFPDGDEAGERCATSVLSQVSPHRFCRWVRLDAGRQPTDCPAEQLRALLAWKVVLP